MQHETNLQLLLDQPKKKMKEKSFLLIINSTKISYTLIYWFLDITVDLSIRFWLIRFQHEY